MPAMERFRLIHKNLWIHLVIFYLENRQRHRFRMFVGSGFIGRYEKDISENSEHKYNDRFKRLSYVSRLLNNNKVDYNQYYPRNGLKACIKCYSLLFTRNG